MHPRSGSGRFQCRYLGEVPEASGAESSHAEGSGAESFDAEGSGADTEVRFQKVPVQILR